MGQIFESSHLPTLKCLIVQHSDLTRPALLFKHIEFHCGPPAEAQPNTSLLKNNTALTGPGWFFSSRWCWWTLPDLTSVNRNLKKSDAGNRQPPPPPPYNLRVCLRRDILLGFAPLSDFPWPLSSSWIMLPEQQGDSLIVRRCTEFRVLFIAKVKVNICTSESVKSGKNSLKPGKPWELRPPPGSSYWDLRPKLILQFLKILLSVRCVARLVFEG